MALEATRMGEVEVPYDEHFYRIEDSRLFIRSEPIWLEYPSIRRRRLIVENTYLDNIHIGGVKMA